VRGAGERKFILEEGPADVASFHEGESDGVGGGGEDVNFAGEGCEPSAFESVSDALEAAFQQSVDGGEGGREDEMKG